MTAKLVDLDEIYSRPLEVEIEELGTKLSDLTELTTTVGTHIDFTYAELTGASAPTEADGKWQEVSFDRDQNKLVVRLIAP